MKRVILLIFYIIVNIFSFSNENILFSEDKSKYVFEGDRYIYITNTRNAREEANLNAKVVAKAFAKSKLEIISIIEEKNDKWYEVNINGKQAFIKSSPRIKERKFNYENAIEEFEKLNEFIKQYNYDIKVVNSYVPLNLEKTRAKDKLGNSSNQSIIAYTSENAKEYYNLPDRTMIAVIGQTPKYIIAKSLLYKEKLYIPKELKKNLINANIVSELSKFVYVDRKNQNQITFEKDKETGLYKVILNGLVTTGKEVGVGFETPYGNFLIAISKPKMLYTSDIDVTEVVGEAKYAIRFSGGAYLHGVPYKYEPVENIEGRKAATKRNLGTVALSHKCVRNEDEKVKEIYDWLGVSKVNKAGHRTPKEPAVVIVR